MRFPYLHQKDGVEDHKSFRQGAGDVGVLVEAEHPGPRGHGHGLDLLHVAAVRVFVVVVDAGVDSVLIERVVRVENLVVMQIGVGEAASKPRGYRDVPRFHRAIFANIDC